VYMNVPPGSLWELREAAVARLGGAQALDGPEVGFRVRLLCSDTVALLIDAHGREVGFLRRPMSATFAEHWANDWNLVAE